jgi:hypothetical protein
MEIKPKIMTDGTRSMSRGKKKFVKCVRKHYLMEEIRERVSS